MASSIHSTRFLAIAVFITLTAMARAASIDATCYLPNGTAAYDNTGVMVRKVILIDKTNRKAYSI